jgi:hypothetical protein
MRFAAFLADSASLPGGLLVSACLPATRHAPFEEFPSSAAVPCHHGRCPLVVTAHFAVSLAPDTVAASPRPEGRGLAVPAGSLGGVGQSFTPAAHLSCSTPLLRGTAPPSQSPEGVACLGCLSTSASAASAARRSEQSILRARSTEVGRSRRDLRSARGGPQVACPLTRCTEVPGLLGSTSLGPAPER